MNMCCIYVTAQKKCLWNSHKHAKMANTSKPHIMASKHFLKKRTYIYPQRTPWTHHLNTKQVSRMSFGAVNSRKGHVVTNFWKRGEKMLFWRCQNGWALLTIQFWSRICFSNITAGAVIMCHLSFSSACYYS